MKRSVIIVGCGYVGSALGEALVRDGHDVVGTTTSQHRTEALREAGVRPELADIADVDRLRELLSDRDSVYLTIAPKSMGMDYREVYLKAAKNVMAAAKETSITRLIYTSSTRVYGQDGGQKVDENSSTTSNDERGQVLVQAEQSLLNPAGLSQADLDCESETERASHTTVVRLTGIYGPQRDPRRRILGAAGSVRDDGDVWVNMIHRDDIVAALVKLLHTPFHGVLNLSDDQPTQRRDYYDRVLEEADLPPIRWTRHAISPKQGKRVSNERIKELLDLTLQHPTH